MMHSCFRRTAILLTLMPMALLCACASAGEPVPPDRVSLFKRTGGRQCEGAGAPLSATERQLTDAGIRVLAASCGQDGQARVAMCGAPTGAIHIVEVPASQRQAALALGLAPLASLPEAARAPCR